MSSFRSSTERFLNLSTEERIIVALGVLIDGHESYDVFLSDPQKKHLAEAVNDLCEIPLPLRTPLVATALREARSTITPTKGGGT